MDTLVAGLLAGGGAGAAALAAPIGESRGLILFVGVAFVDMAREEIAGADRGEMEQQAPSRSAPSSKLVTAVGALVGSVASVCISNTNQLHNVGAGWGRARLTRAHVPSDVLRPRERCLAYGAFVVAAHVVVEWDGGRR